MIQDNFCFQLKGKETSGLKTGLKLLKDSNFLPASEDFSALESNQHPGFQLPLKSCLEMMGWVA